MNKFKLAGAVLTALVCLSVGYKLAPVQTKEVTVYQDRVVVKDRIVTKDVVRTETRPDGTKIVTTETSKDTAHTDTKEVRKESVTVHSNVTHYSLGINLRPESIFPFKGIYTVEIGRRVFDTPLWITASGNTKKEFTVGLRFEI